MKLKRRRTKPVSSKALEALRAHAWKPGQSGNPNGRPRKLPLTDDLAKVMASPIPNDIRAKLKKRGITIPVGATYSFVIAQRLADRAVDEVHVPSVREIADRVEGKPTQRIEFEGSARRDVFIHLVHDNPDGSLSPAIIDDVTEVLPLPPAEVH